MEVGYINQLYDCSAPRDQVIMNVLIYGPQILVVCTAIEELVPPTGKNK